jgi:hypothetical protein
MAGEIPEPIPFEPQVKWLDQGVSNAEAATVSIAISLKRIADTLDEVVRNGAAINVDARCGQ